MGRTKQHVGKGYGLGCACNAAARRLAAHLPSRPRQQRGGGGSAAAALLAKQLRNNQFTKPLFVPQASLPATCSPRKAMTHARVQTPRMCVMRLICKVPEISILTGSSAENK